MKIEIITDTYRPDVNGVAMTLGRLTDGLKDRGHRVHVLHTGAEAAAGESSARSVSLPGYRDVRVGLPKPFDLRQRWERKRPDVIYVATESPLGKSALKSAKALGIPSVTGFHTNFHQYMERYGMPGMQSLAKSYLRKFHTRAQCTMTPSPGMVKELKEIGIENVELLGRGDTDLFSPARRCDTLRAEWGVDAETPVAVIVGRVAAEKNLELGMKAFERMRKVFPGMACVVVGDGPVRKSLEQTWPWVKFVGMQTATTPLRTFCFFPVRRKLSVMCCSRAWPAVWCQSVMTTPPRPCTSSISATASRHPSAMPMPSSSSRCVLSVIHAATSCAFRPAAPPRPRVGPA